MGKQGEEAGAYPLALEERLRAHVEALAGQIGARHVGRPEALARARDYIATRLKEFGYEVARQDFTAPDPAGREVAVCNLVAELAGAEPKEPEVLLLGAHYDSAPNPAGNPGADDNASAVAGLLEAARLLRASPKPPRRMVCLVAFVNEEAPFFRTPQMGSAVYARDARARGERLYLAVILEMIGYFSAAPGSQRYDALGPELGGLAASLYPSTADFAAALGNAASQGRINEFVRAFRAHSPLPLHTSPGVPVMDQAIEQLCLSDNMAFWAEGYPALMLGDLAFVRNPHYHQPTDTPETLDYRRMAELTRGVVGALGEL